MVKKKIHSPFPTQINLLNAFYQPFTVTEYFLSRHLKYEKKSNKMEKVA